jgi:hypothetical protein
MVGARQASVAEACPHLRLLLSVTSDGRPGRDGGVRPGRVVSGAGAVPVEHFWLRQPTSRIVLAPSHLQLASGGRRRGGGGAVGVLDTSVCNPALEHLAHAGVRHGALLAEPQFRPGGPRMPCPSRSYRRRQSAVRAPKRAALARRPLPMTTVTS